MPEPRGGGGGAARPFVKWAGGKGQLLPEIRRRYPAGLGHTIRRYAEPFVGGGAVLLDVLTRFDIEEAYASDSNPELINAYRAVRDGLEPLLGLLGAYEAEYLAADGEARKCMYLANRSRYNALRGGHGAAGGSAELAALLIFLNRTGFNGLYRVNARGAYNVPHGRYGSPRICDRGNLRAVSRLLQKVTLACGDYARARDFIDGRTFAYLDPPYRPLTATARFTAYTPQGFDDAAQGRLAAFFGEMAARGAWVVASNSDPRNADAGDLFMDRLYAGHEVARVWASRRINRLGRGRGPMRELLVTGVS